MTMRMTAMMMVLTITALSLAQPPVVPNPAPRFNVLFNERFFSQASPKETLAAVVKAAELGQFDYIAAYLLDEVEADALIASRATDVQTATDNDLRIRRQQERSDPFRPAVENPLPLEPKAFEDRVRQEATRRGFEQLVRDLRERFAEDPAHIRELQNFLRNGDVTMADKTARITLKTDKGREMFFKKVGNRWFMENRTKDAPARPAAN